MSEIRTLLAILEHSTDGRAWHGPPVMGVLKGITAKQAAAKPVVNAHSIWEILLHMNAWQDFTLRSLDGEDVPMLEGAADWPEPPKPSDAAWQETVAAFENGAARIRQALSDYRDEDLRKAAPGKEYTFKVLLHGIAHHNLYHAGQIALLKKAV